MPRSDCPPSRSSSKTRRSYDCWLLPAAKARAVSRRRTRFVHDRDSKRSLFKFQRRAQPAKSAAENEDTRLVAGHSICRRKRRRFTTLVIMASAKQTDLRRHVAALLKCRRCPRMKSTPVSGGAIVSEVMLIGQAPGPREPVLQRPFAHTAGQTLFHWFEQSCGLTETQVRSKIYFAAVCRCFPGKNSGGGDRVPAPDEIRNCSSWLDEEIAILKPRLIIPVGRLAIGQFIECAKLENVIGQTFCVQRMGRPVDLIPLPHPSGASPWHKIPPGSALLAKALRKIARHEAMWRLTSP